MKTALKHNRHGQGGYTAAEMIIACAVLVILGLAFFQVLNSGMILYAKNTAVNSAHEEAREGINRLTRDIHASVSVPQLRDSTHDATYTIGGSFPVISSQPVGGVPPTAAGVSFQNVAPGSPAFVWKDPANDNFIMVKDAPPPAAGMRLVVPFWGIEDNLEKVSASAGNPGKVNIFSDNAMEQILAKKAPVYSGGDAYAIVYFTERMLYVVENGTYIPDSQGPWINSGGQYIAYTSGSMQRYRYERGELNVYRQRDTCNGQGGCFYWQKLATVAKYVSTPQPFYIPLNSGGSPDTKYVGIRLSTRDPSTSNRKYLATASLLDTQVDYRSRLCLYQ